VLNEIETLKAAREEAEGFATRMTTSIGERVSGGAPVGEKLLIEVAEYRGEIDAQITSLYAILREISGIIYAVNESVLRQLLINRYIRLMTWENVAVTMNYSYYHVFDRLKPKAHKAVGELLEWEKDVIKCYSAR